MRSYVRPHGVPASIQLRYISQFVKATWAGATSASGNPQDGVAPAHVLPGISGSLRYVNATASVIFSFGLQIRTLAEPLTSLRCRRG
jgi:hypothetical protein